MGTLANKSRKLLKHIWNWTSFCKNIGILLHCAGPRGLEHDTIEPFTTRLRIISQYCEFGNAADYEIAGQVVQACFSDKLHRQLLQIETLNLKDVLYWDRIYDYVEAQAHALEEKPFRDESNAIATNPRAKQTPRTYHKQRPQTQSTNQASNTTVSKGRQSNVDKTRCTNCGGQYPHRDLCPAFKKNCLTCDKPNHFASVCRSTNSTRSKTYSSSQQNQSRFGAPSPNRPSDQVNSINSTPNGDSFSFYHFKW